MAAAEILNSNAASIIRLSAVGRAIGNSNLTSTVIAGVNQLFCHRVLYYSSGDRSFILASIVIMAGPGHGKHGQHPVHIHPVPRPYRFFATGLGAAMWFFLFYRARQDGPALLGWKHPWDH